LDNVLDIGSRKKDRKKYLQETETLLSMLFGRAVESGYTEAHEVIRVNMLLAEKKLSES